MYGSQGRDYDCFILMSSVYWFKQVDLSALLNPRLPQDFSSILALYEIILTARAGIFSRRKVVEHGTNVSSGSSGAQDGGETWDGEMVVAGGHKRDNKLVLLQAQMLIAAFVLWKSSLYVGSIVKNFSSHVWNFYILFPSASSFVPITYHVVSEQGLEAAAL